MAISVQSGQNVRNAVLVAVIPQKGTLSGVVTDSQTGQPVAGVTVNLGGVTTITDSNGVYAFSNITPGSYELSFSKSGYTTTNI